MVGTRMEAKFDIHETRMNQLEHQIELLTDEVRSSRSDFNTLKSLVAGLIDELRTDKGKTKLDFEEGGGSGVFTKTKTDETSGGDDREDRGDDKSKTEDKKQEASSSHTESPNVDHSIFRKLEIPLFSGDDPLGWIFRAERYFKVNKVTEGEKRDAAVLCFEG